MADLPIDRLSPGPPFTSVGVDVFLTLGDNHKEDSWRGSQFKTMGSYLHLPDNTWYSY
ncbi:hypothetical protein DPMN_084603 [Dreissena polymorpha]|uniref:Uncharacterized protein n=1 Tax=Dreissena polymorpha TaxID=45954 RepID=A0A9D4BC57_DREPO|nr:hypothetical protein DPMN_084603 [Dreissena polymorpha]